MLLRGHGLPGGEMPLASSQNIARCSGILLSLEEGGMLFDITSVNREGALLREMSQTEKAKCRIRSLIHRI